MGIPYTLEEDKLILKLLKQQRAWQWVGSQHLWQQMADQIFLNRHPQRTGSALMDHYRKKLKNEVDTRRKSVAQKKCEKKAELDKFSNKCPNLDFRKPIRSVEDWLRNGGSQSQSRSRSQSQAFEPSSQSSPEIVILD